MDEGEANCAVCGSLRVPDVVAECRPGSEFASIPLGELGFGIMEIIAARSDDETVGIEISGDRQALFGG